MEENQSQNSKKGRPGRKRGVKVKHGAYSLIARGDLPQKRRYLEKHLSEVRKGLIRDLGPDEENLTTAQLILIDRAVGKLGVLRCVEEFAKEKGVMEGKELSPILRQNYLSWSNSLRLDLVALGIDRKQLDGPDIQQVMREFDEQKAKDQGKRAESDSKALSKAGQGVDKGGREK